MELGAFDHQRASLTELYEPRQTRPNRSSVGPRLGLDPEGDGRINGPELGLPGRGLLEEGGVALHVLRRLHALLRTWDLGWA